MTATKKTIISSVCIAAAAAAVIIGAVLFNKTKTTPETEQIEQTHVFKDSDIELIKSADRDVTVYLFKDKSYFTDSSVTAEISYELLLEDMASLNSKIKQEFITGADAAEKKTQYSVQSDMDCLMVSGSDSRIIEYSQITKTHPSDGTLYAIDRNGLMAPFCSLCGIEYIKEENLIAVTSKYDKDGDLLGSSLRPFIYPNIERKNVKRIAVTNSEDSFFAIRSSDSSFFFAYEGDDGDFYPVNTSYDASMLSSLVVSSLYTLAESKTYSETTDEYGLADKSKATLILEIYTETGEHHVIVVGNKTPSGNGYYAKYYYLYSEGHIGSESAVALMQKADVGDDIAEYTYTGKTFAEYGAEFYTKPYVYIIGTDIEVAALHPLNDFLTGELVYSVRDQQSITKIDDIHIAFGKTGEEVVAQLIEDTELTGKTMEYIWKITAPKEYFSGDFATPSNGFFDALNTMITLQAEKIVEYKMKKGEDGVYYFDEEILKKYGLDDPEVTFSYLFNDSENSVKTRTKAYLSAKDENGKRYVYSYVYLIDGSGAETPYTTGVIATVSNDTVPWTEWSCVQFIDPSIFDMYIDFVNGITVEYDDKKFEFIMLKEDGTITDVSCNGKRTDLQSVRYMYQTILACKRIDKYVPGGETPAEMMRMTIKTDEKEYAFVFYRISVKKALCKLNGDGDYYVSADIVSQIEEEAEKISRGEILTKP